MISQAVLKNAGLMGAGMFGDAYISGVVNKLEIIPSAIRPYSTLAVGLGIMAFSGMAKGLRNEVNYFGAGVVLNELMSLLGV